MDDYSKKVSYRIAPEPHLCIGHHGEGVKGSQLSSYLLSGECAGLEMYAHHPAEE